MVETTTFKSYTVGNLASAHWQHTGTIATASGWYDSVYPEGNIIKQPSCYLLRIRIEIRKRKQKYECEYEKEKEKEKEKYEYEYEYEKEKEKEKEKYEYEYESPLLVFKSSLLIASWSLSFVNQSITDIFHSFKF